MAQIPIWIPEMVTAILGVVRKEFISKIEAEDIRQAASSVLDAVEQTAFAFADENPQDAEQAREIWNRFINEDVTVLMDSQLAVQIAKIKEDAIRIPLSHLAVPIVDMLRVVTDENTKDDEQLKALWLEFIRSAEVQNAILDFVLKPALERAGVGAGLIDFILTAIKSLLSGLK